MRAPSSRTRKIAGFAAGPLAVVAAGAMVWQGSSAAFTANTTSANNWTTGQIKLTDNDVQEATFNVAGLAPGDTGSRCITVTADSSVNVQGTIYASVKNLVNGTDSTKDFSDQLKLAMVTGGPSSGTGSVAADCSNFVAANNGVVFPSTALSALAATTTAPVSAGSAPKGITSVVYKVSYEFNTTGLTQEDQNALMGSTTGATLAWELKAGA
ncbi:TasA family protein [Arthrobacter sp. MPF02]|uniref:TasA family protein n=1 Tax=Arthrobacter sp. MPF02 TaxID=3388492 RepID=UPI003984B952